MSKLSPFICPNLHKGASNISHGFFTRRGGVSTGIYGSLNTGHSSDDNAQRVQENRNRIVAHMGFNCDDLITPWQIHSSDVVIITKDWGANRPKADGIVTNTPGLPIAIGTADCGPVLFCDPQNNVIGATHSGWRGATGGVLEQTIEKMLSLGAARTSINATLGPTISKQNYEVGPEFVDNLISLAATNDKYLSPSPNEHRAHFDLPAYIVDRLSAAGVNARSTGQCTYNDEKDFFSYRRMTHRGEADYGRQMSAIAIDTK